MKKEILSVDQFYLKANVEKGVCPLNWLVEYYREYPGKLVMLDKYLTDFLINKARYDTIEAGDYDGYKQSFTIVWNATDEWPETRIVVSSYGRDKIEKEEDKYIIDSDTNYYVIEELYADDILVNGEKYAENMQTDKQIIYLVTKGPTEQDVKEK